MVYSWSRSFLAAFRLFNVNLRCAQSTFKVPQRLLWWKKVIILILQVIQLEVTSSIHPQQLIAYTQHKSDISPQRNKGRRRVKGFRKKRNQKEDTGGKCWERDLSESHGIKRAQTSFTIIQCSPFIIPQTQAHITNFSAIQAMDSYTHRANGKHGGNQDTASDCMTLLQLGWWACPVEKWPHVKMICSCYWRLLTMGVQRWIHSNFSAESNDNH